METRQHKSNSGVKKRSPNACIRCRQQKVKCSGTLPCSACSRRSLVCSFDDSAKKVLVTNAYLQDLQRRAEQQVSSEYSNTASPSRIYDGHDDSTIPTRSGSHFHDPADLDLMMLQDVPDALHSEPRLGSPGGVEDNNTSSPGTDLVNLFAIDSNNYMADYLGRHIHLGTSSNWTFSRRVLSTACERLGLQIPTDPIYFEGSVYDLNWTNLTSRAPTPTDDLFPSVDYALHLINAVKFHCGQMFHLFDEQLFMRYFYIFHETEDGPNQVPKVWYTHYLVLLALAKLLVARDAQSVTPPGADLFLAAMENWPELIFVRQNVTECVEVLVCAAIYLQCLDYRSLAWTMMGQAVRKALEQGLHTSMSHRAPDSPVVQRCRRIWWTIYVLDRQLSTSVGAPQTIRDDYITAEMPTFPTFKEDIGLDIHVKLCRAIASIVNTVYSLEGRVPQKFLASAKQALQNIAKITELLSTHIQMPKNFSRGGIPRFGAYLHLLNHQCICLTTRPLLFNFLDRRLTNITDKNKPIELKGSAQVLLRMCVDSAQQMLNILVALKNEGLLESFLPFDLEATFVAAIVLMVAKTIDEKLLEDHESWTNIAFSILDDMMTRGNRIALARKRELQHLYGVLKCIDGPQLPTLDTAEIGLEGQPVTTQEQPANPNHHALDADIDEFEPFYDPFWQDEMTAEQLRDVAQSLDLNGFDWMTTSLDSAST